MANAIYPLYKQALLAGDANTDLDTNTATDGVYAALIDTGIYTYSASHQFYTSIASAIVGTPQRITSPTVANGVFDGADVTFPSVTGNTAEAIVYYRQNSGANSTWRLVAYQDTGVATLPVTPNGGNIVVQWDPSGIFAL